MIPLHRQLTQFSNKFSVAHQTALKMNACDLVANSMLSHIGVLILIIWLDAPFYIDVRKMSGAAASLAAPLFFHSRHCIVVSFYCRGGTWLFDRISRNGQEFNIKIAATLGGDSIGTPGSRLKPAVLIITWRGLLAVRSTNMTHFIAA